MKELSIIEMESIAGAYSWDFSSVGSSISSLFSNGVEAIASAVVMAGTCAQYGNIIGGTHGGDNGGIIGVGTIGMAVGSVWGMVVGGIGGAIAGVLLGWEDSSAISSAGYESWMNGNHNIF